jgi:hypothetical protein
MRLNEPDKAIEIHKDSYFDPDKKARSRLGQVFPQREEIDDILKCFWRLKADAGDPNISRKWALFTEQGKRIGHPN